MSKIGKINISIPEKVKVALAGNILNIEGPLGKKSLNIDLDVFKLDIKEGKEISIKPIKINLIDKIWKRKKTISNSVFYNLPKLSVGSNYQQKIDKIVSNLKKKGADFHFITASENNAWLLNIRGSDTKYSPIPYCYSLIDKSKNIKFFCDLKKITSSFEKNLKNIDFLEMNLADKVLARLVGKKFIIDDWLNI